MGFWHPIVQPSRSDLCLKNARCRILHLRFFEQRSLRESRTLGAKTALCDRAQYSNGQFLTLTQSNINSVAEINNKKIGTLKFSQLRSIVIQYTSNENLHEYSNITDLMDALANHQIDAILLNAIFSKYFINNSLIGLKLIGKPITLGNGYGIIALKRHAALINRINTILLEMEHDGNYLKIYNQYYSS